MRCQPDSGKLPTFFYALIPVKLRIFFLLGPGAIPDTAVYILLGLSGILLLLFSAWFAKLNRTDSRK